jgi:hypothetical protein
MRQDFGAEPFIPKEFAIVVGAEFENVAMPRAGAGHSHGLRKASLPMVSSRPAAEHWYWYRYWKW